MKSEEDDIDIFRRLVQKLSRKEMNLDSPYSKDTPRPKAERSFTIIETLAALAILLPVVIETVSTQGSIINNNTYMRRMTEATWLAKRIMTQVEYNYVNYPLKKLDIEVEERFKIENTSEDFDYTYKLTIREWKLPLFDILLNGGPAGASGGDSGEEESSSGGVGSLPGVEAFIKKWFEGHILKTAYVEVFWPEGAVRNSVSLTLLLTNQQALDKFIVANKKVMKDLLEAIEKQYEKKDSSSN